MSPISARFAELRERGEKALVLFVTAGDPDLAELPAILDALTEAGADLIELGLPFSDPIADGPTIQASSQRALERGVTTDAVFDALHRAACPTPVLLMGYLNPILRRGYERFARQAVDAGASGTIVCDVIPEEGHDWNAAAHAAGLDTIYLAAPTSTDERLDAVCQASSGFVYAVSRTGVTGASSDVPPEARRLVGLLKERTSLPVCVGFGISRPEHVRAVCEVADGAVVGSWLVDQLAREWRAGLGRADLVRAVRALKEATR